MVVKETKIPILSLRNKDALSEDLRGNWNFSFFFTSLVTHIFLFSTTFLLVRPIKYYRHHWQKRKGSLLTFFTLSRTVLGTVIGIGCYFYTKNLSKKFRDFAR